ncbi:unnamed protein product [Orchesella dallaii]|uniref:Peptidase S1 domain-containing protein n=1 Tax=Orchesella dallaii TaxID=48710 RepID=A0ABP1RPV6_9HEXA
MISKRILAIFLSIIAVVSAAPAKTDSETFIIGGETADKDEFPWLVRYTVLPASGESRFCLGTLVDSDLVLTSASCVIGNSRPITVIAGDHLLLEVEGTEQSVASSEVVLHENFNSTGGLDNDIALIRLASHLTSTTSVKPVTLPRNTSDPVYYGYGIQAGWGETEEGGLSPVLLKAWVDIRDNYTCAEHGLTIPEGQVCSVDDKGAYKGDTGGPISCYGRQWEICGVLSTVGIDNTTIVGGYTNVALYLDWIAAHRSTYFQIEPLAVVLF